jgi:hypothetical protein
MNPESLQRASHFLFWLSVILPILGAAAVVGRFYVERQEKRISAQSAAELREIAETTRDYADMAQLNPAGLPFKEGTGIRFDTPLSTALRDCYVVRGEIINFKIDADYEARYRQIIAEYARFPFAYLALAETLRNEGKPEWREVAKKGLDIFKRTTAIAGHDKAHDDGLATLERYLSSAP